MSPGIFLDAIPSSGISGNPSRHSQNMFLQCDRKGSRFQYLSWNMVLELKNSADLVSLLFHACSIIFPVLPGPNPQEDDKFSGFQKRFPELHIEFRVSSGSPESRLSIPLVLGNIQRLAGNVVCSRAARCVRIIKNSCIGQRIHLVLQVLSFSGRIPLLL